MKQCLPWSMAYMLPALMCSLLAAACAGGCADATPPPGGIEIKPPLSLMLPHTIRVHPFTGLRTLEAGVRGLDVRMEALDAYEDTTKAFGTFRFELYEFKPYSSNRKGALIESWEVDLMNSRENVIRWDPITRSYRFKLGLNESVPAGRRLVLAVSFESPYSFNRLFAPEYEFIAQ
jgi:hypothetical protein